MFSLSTKILVVLGAAAIVFFAGWQTRDAFCDAAAAKAEVVNLRKQLEATRVAAEQDKVKANVDAEKLDTLEGTIRDLESKISIGVCFSVDDVERLRGLWR